MRYEELKGTIDDLCSVNQESDIITFYKWRFIATDPTITELVGTALV